MITDDSSSFLDTLGWGDNISRAVLVSDAQTSVVGISSPTLMPAPTVIAPYLSPASVMPFHFPTSLPLSPFNFTPTSVTVTPAPTSSSSAAGLSPLAIVAAVVALWLIFIELTLSPKTT